MKAPSVKIPLLSRGKASEPPGIVAVARVDRRTKNITKRLNPGEIAVIDHADLDRVSAEELVRRKVAAVVNASVSITGRYPNLGRSEEHTSELQSRRDLVCRLLLEKKKIQI